MGSEWTMIRQPAIGDFRFRLFNRPLHPELLDVVSNRTVTRGACTIAVSVMPWGHVVHWQANGVTAVELTAGPEQPLPERGLLLDYRFDRDRSADCPFAPGWRYRLLSQIERLPTDHFEAVHADLLVDGRRRGLLVSRPSASRLRLPALTWIDITPLVGGLAVTALHTFPAERAVAKSQSLIEPVRRLSA